MQNPNPKVKCFLTAAFTLALFILNSELWFARLQPSLPSVVTHCPEANVLNLTLT